MQTIKSRWHSESGAGGTFIYFLLSLPFFWMIFAYTIDHQIASYARDQVENNAQISIASAATQLEVNSHKISTTQAKRIAIEQYTLNRDANTKHVACAKTSDLKTGETLQGGTCKWILKSFTRAADQRSVTMTVKEVVPANLSSAFNKAGYTLNVKVSATTRQSR